MPKPTRETRVLPVLKFFNRRTGAEEIAIAIDIVDARGGWPEFVFACPGRGEGCLFARVGAIAFIRCDLSRRMRGILEQVVLAILFSAGDRFDLRVDGDHRVAETIKL